MDRWIATTVSGSQVDIYRTHDLVNGAARGIVSRVFTGDPAGSMVSCETNNGTNISFGISIGDLVDRLRHSDPVIDLT